MKSLKEFKRIMKMWCVLERLTFVCLILPPDSLSSVNNLGFIVMDHYNMIQYAHRVLT